MANEYLDKTGLQIYHNKVKQELTGVKSQLAESVQLISDLETNKATNLELITGLELKRDKATLITTNDIDKSSDANKIHLLDLSEEVQSAMAGTSPVIATVDDGSITKEKYANKSVHYSKTDFLELDTDINMFDGNYTTGISISTAGLVSVADSNRKIALIPIQPNTTYSLIRTDNIANFFKVFTHTLPSFSVDDTLNGSIKTDRGGLNNYTFTSGENDVLLCAFVTYTGEDVFLQVIEGTQTVFTTSEYPIVPKNISIYKKSETYNKSEVDNLTNVRKIKVIKTGTTLDIYIPSKKNTNYLHYIYKYIENATINMYQWKIYTIEIVDNNLLTLYPFITDIEWEGVVKELGAVDFLGGYHGDETNVILNLMIDGIEYDINGSDFNIEINNEIKIINKSTINRCNTPGDNVFTRYKVSTWNNENYIVENKWIALQSVVLDRAYLTMLSLPILSNSEDIAKYSRYDDGYVKQPTVGDAVSGSCLYPSTEARIFEMWSDNFYGKVESIADYDNYSSHVIGDRSQTNIMKAYFAMAKNYTVAVNEKLKCKSIYTFIF